MGEIYNGNGKWEIDSATKFYALDYNVVHEGFKDQQVWARAFKLDAKQLKTAVREVKEKHHLWVIKKNGLGKWERYVPSMDVWQILKDEDQDSLNKRENIS